MQTKDEKREYNRRRYQLNRDKILGQVKVYASENRDKRKAYEVKVREQALEAYGHKCQCCREGRSEFLAIDHINGDGNKMRKGRVNGHPARGGLAMYLWLRKNEYPDTFRLLCHNCNMSYAMYGYCPHGGVNE